MGENDELLLAIVNLQNMFIMREAYSLGMLNKKQYKSYIHGLMAVAIKANKGGLNGTDEELSDMAGGEVPKQSPGNDMG